jgi:hypothetical protein
MFARFGTIARALLIVAAATASRNARAQGITDPAVTVQSQENQSGSLAAAWLGSSDARTRSWGAYLVLRDQRHELLPQLKALAEAYVVKDNSSIPTERGNHDTMVGVLDTIIQLGGAFRPPRRQGCIRSFLRNH